MNSGEPKALRWGTGPTPVAPVLVALNDDGVVAIEFLDSAANAIDRLHARFPNALIQGELPADDPAVAAVQTMVTDGTPAPVRLAAAGTKFEHLVWSALLEIPPGKTRSYAEVAEAIGRPRAVRAVASACARNPVAVVVPCHRVVRTDGSLGGYAYGLAIKEHLLAVERQRAAAA